ncbi:MAG: helix-turn-helix transcriptional regulator [Sphingobacteriales bacterium]|nr:helix-turn-helix transcriptional regulator [Sphingobacteriales bacterium]
MKLKTQNRYYKLAILDGLELLDAKQHTLSFPFHTHPTFNITLVLEQIFSTKLCDRFLQAPVGTIVVTNPEEVHATICDNKIGSSFFTFYVSPDVLTELNGNKSVFFEDKIISDTTLFQELFILSQHFSTSGPGFENCLLKALRRLVTRHSVSPFVPTKRSSHFQKLLEEETFEKFSLEYTASKFGLDKFKFLRLFKQETGLTPNNYIILKRIEKCKQLLKTQTDLLDIAIQTGFYDATHLCRHFKKITGITPLHYHKA